MKEEIKAKEVGRGEFKRILIISNEFPPGPGGIGNQAFNLAVYFVKANYRVHVYTASRKEFRDVEFDMTFPFSISRYSVNSSFVTKLKESLYFLFTKGRSFDYYILSGSVQLLFAFPLYFFPKSKCISIIHGHELSMATGIYRKLLRLSLRMSDDVIAVSEFSKSRLSQYGLKRKVEVVPNGVVVPPDFIREDDKTFSTDGVLRLVTVGSVTARKGQQNVIKAIPFLRSILSTIEYHIIGIPTELANLNATVQSLGVSKNVIVHGVVSEADKVSILRKMDIFIMLSENLENGDVEGFGIAIIEANLLGIPAIGSKGTGVEQAIDEGNSGVLVNAYNPEEIGNAIIQIRNSYNKFSESSIKWAQKHDWSYIGDAYAAIMKK